MGRKIEDEFTALPISNSRRHQLRNKRDGKCVSCSKPAVTTHYCQFHHDKKKEYGAKSRKTNPLVFAAYQAVATALRNGSLVRQKCEVEGCEKMGESHHEDYSRPLDVKWICKRHHNEAHGKFSSAPDTGERFRFSREAYLKRHAEQEKARRARLRAARLAA